VANIGGWEIAIVVVIILLIFGPKKLPDLGRSLGRSISGFKKGLREHKDEVVDTVAQVKDAMAVDEIKSTVAEVRDAAGVKDVKSAISEVRAAAGVDDVKAAVKEIRDSVDVKATVKEIKDTVNLKEATSPPNASVTVSTNSTESDSTP
jgi:sec-independent protein translocase protein TatA